MTLMSALLNFIAESNSAYCDRCYHSVVCMYACHLLLMHPAKAVGWNEMLFGRNTHVDIEGGKKSFWKQVFTPKV